MILTSKHGVKTKDILGCRTFQRTWRPCHELGTFARKSGYCITWQARKFGFHQQVTLQGVSLQQVVSYIMYIYIYDYLHRQWSLSQRSSAASAPGSQWLPGLWGVGGTGSRLRQNMCCSCSSQLVESLLYNYSHFDTVDGCEILHQLIDGWSMFIPLPIEFQPSLIDRCKISSIHLHPQYHID